MPNDLKGISNSTRNDSAIENRNYRRDDFINTGGFEYERDNPGKGCGNYKLNCGHLDCITFRGKSVAPKDMSCKKNGAYKDKGVAKSKHKLLFNAEKIHAYHSNDYRNPRFGRSFYFENNQIQYGDKEHIHSGDESRLACGCVNKTNLLNKACRCQKQATSNTADEGAFCTRLLVIWIWFVVFRFKITDNANDNNKYSARAHSDSVEGDGLDMVHSRALKNECKAPTY